MYPSSHAAPSRNGNHNQHTGSRSSASVPSSMASASGGRYRVSKPDPSSRSRKSFLLSKGMHNAVSDIVIQASNSDDDATEDIEESEIIESEDEKELAAAQSEASLHPHESDRGSDDDCVTGMTDFYLPTSSCCMSPSAWSAAKANRFKQDNLELMWYDGRATVHRRISDRVHDRLYLHPGIIFSAAHHTANYDNDILRAGATIAYDDPHRTSTAFGVVFSKYRKFVVLRTFGLGILCLPIYSHNGSGFAHKLNHGEYVAVRDSRVPASDGSESECESEYAFEADSECVVAYMNLLHDQTPRPILSSKSAIFLAEPVLMRFNTLLTIEGCLSMDDVTRLQDLFRSLF